MLSYTQEELNIDILKKVLPEVLRIHDENAREIDYLYNYYKGNMYFFPDPHGQGSLRPIFMYSGFFSFFVSMENESYGDLT